MVALVPLILEEVVDGGAYSGNGGDARGNGGTGGYEGGAGNPAAAGGNSGTGGLLVIDAKKIINESSITSCGSNGGLYRYSMGGSSGGGSINIFYKETCEKGSLNANGGSRRSGGTGGTSGAGGTGSITVGSIATGSFVSD